MAKKRRAPPPAKAPAPPKAAKPAAKFVGGVTLFGEVLPDGDADHIHFMVANCGDAKELGLCGQHWFTRRQLFPHPSGKLVARVDNFDIIRVPFALASLKATRCQPCD